ncbi:MAG: MCE family protein [Winogradskyella sp.]|nr:MCE family protein [Winogradskyella sp.]
MKISREVKTAVLVISGIFLFIYLYTYLKGEDLFSKTETYYTEFDYNALSMSSPVTIKGNSVGKINDITYDFETGKTVVSFTVNPKLKFSKNSIVRLYETGLMGGNALAIVNTNDGETAQPGDKLASEVQPGLITSLKNNFTGISSDLDSTIRSADTLFVNLNKVIKDTSDESLQSTIAELNATLKSFKRLAISLESVVSANESKINASLESFTKTSENITTLTNDIKDVELSKTISTLDNTLSSMNALLSDIQQGKGSMGKLMNDESLYNNLEGATKEMEELLRDIKLHPKRYFRILSRKEIPYEGDEN